jgi:hypothetical protein
MKKPVQTVNYPSSPYGGIFIEVEADQQWKQL